MTITAYLDDIRPYCGMQHGVEAAKVAAIVAQVEAEGAWKLPPVLVIENEGNGPTLLDGHHRAEAAKVLELSSIPAYVVPLSELAAVLEEHFDGYMPDRLTDLDDYILVDGRPYGGREMHA